MSPRKHRHSQQAYEEIFNTISHQGITNQNHSELSLHTHQDGYDFFFYNNKLFKQVRFSFSLMEKKVSHCHPARKVT